MNSCRLSWSQCAEPTFSPDTIAMYLKSIKHSNRTHRASAKIYNFSSNYHKSGTFDSDLAIFLNHQTVNTIFERTLWEYLMAILGQPAKLNACCQTAKLSVGQIYHSGIFLCTNLHC